MLTALVGSAFMLAACGSPQDPSPPRAPAAKPATVRVFASSAAAPVGSRISVSLGGTMADGTPVAGVDGWLRFAPAALRYVGVAEDAATTIAANDSGATRGRVRVLAVRPGQLNPDAPVLAFDVLKADYLGTLAFEAGAAVSPTGKLQRGGGTRRAEVRSSLSAVATIRPSDTRKNGVKQLMLPTIYGDADASGAVAQGDANLVGAWVVGNGAPPDTVTFNIVNVAPQNLPGIGGPTDTLPPGWGPPFLWGGFLRRAALNDPPISLVCERMLNLDDLLLISQEAGGTNVEVPGEVMPAGSQRPACADAPADTTRPTLPDTLALPAPTVTVARPGSPAGVLYYRDLVGIRFDDSTSGTTIRAVLADYNAIVIGGLPWVDEYIVRIPDPGATWSDYDSLLTQLEQEQGVDYVAGVTSRSAFRIKGRYPTDGPGLQRSNWLSTTPGAPARPLVAIRAPLAWGCETGTYGAARVKVGVLDLQFDLQHPDLTPNSILLAQPPLDRLDPQVLLAPDEVDHGTAVAGVMTAAGDNLIAATGVLWRSNLHVFALARDNQFVRDPTAFAAGVLFPLAATSGVRVLVNSLDFGDTDVRGRSRLRLALRRYIDYQDGNLFVMAADEGASPRRTSFATAILGPGSTSLGLERAFAELFATGARERLLVISATDNNDQLAFFSDHYPDATELVAPGVDILTLTDGGGTRLDTGTSYAAPLVAGAAGLLVAFHPSLRGEDIKDYLVRGAAEPRIDPNTGAQVPPPSIGGLQGRLLDLYGSLTLLSREVPGTPICGVEVSAPDSRSQTELEIHRNSVQRFPAARGGRVSVAQGGRRLALGNETFDTTFVYSHTGQLLHILPGVYQRFYTEKDTVDLQYYMQHLGGFDRDATRVRRTGPSGFVDWFDPGDRARGTATRWFDGSVVPSPDGKWIVLWASYDMTAQCSNQPNLYAHFRIFLVPLGSAGFTALHANVRQGAGQSCTPEGDPADRFEDFTAAWRPAADSLVLAFPRFNDTGPFLGSRLEIRAAVANSPPGTTSTDPAFLYIWSIEPDGVRLRTVHASGSGCEFRRLLAASPFTDLGSEPGCVQFEDEVDRVLPLLRNSRRTAMRATPTTRH